MKTKTTETDEMGEKAVEAPSKFGEDEDGMPYALDEQGKRIPDENIIERGTKPEPLEFRAAGQDHLVFVVMSGISLDTRAAPQTHFRKRAVELGIAELEETPEGEEPNPETARRAEEIERTALMDPERLKLRAQIAVEAIARTNDGRFRISIPQFQRDLTAQKLADDEIFGRRVINEIEAAVAAFFTA